MNLFILDSSNREHEIPRTDPRAVHILEVLHKQEGDSIRAGTPDGSVGLAYLTSITDSAIHLSYEAVEEAAPLRPIHVLIGTVRPIQAARIVKELTVLGVSSIIFHPTELGEKSYTQSNFYRKQEYIRPALEGAAQAGNPRLPSIRLVWSFEKAIACLEEIDADRFFCHLHDDALPLGSVPLQHGAAILSIGTERGWTEQEAETAGRHGFRFCLLGDRILKTETAAVAAVSVMLARKGFL